MKMSADAEDSKVQEQVAIPITETSEENSKKIPKVVFIDNTEAWVEKYTDDALFA